MATKSLEERYEAAADKVRKGGTAADRKAYHALRDELIARTAEARVDRTSAAVTADSVEVN